VAIITAIEPDPRGSKRRAIHLEGECWRKTSVEVVRALGLHSGQEHHPEALEAAIAAEEPSAAHTRALRLLAHRERSTSELRDRLLQDGYPEPLVGDLSARLVGAGLLDDSRFADMLARSLAARGLGATRVKRELAAKGVPEDLARGLLAERFGPDDEDERARSQAARLARSGRRDPERIAAALARKGFSSGVSWRAAKEAAAEFAEEHSTEALE
jgi:regulatory protein